MAHLYRFNSRKRFKDIYQLSLKDFTYVIDNAVKESGSQNAAGFEHTSKAEAYFFRGNTYSWLDKWSFACRDWRKGSRLGHKESQEAYRESC